MASGKHGPLNQQATELGSSCLAINDKSPADCKEQKQHKYYNNNDDNKVSFRIEADNSDATPKFLLQKSFNDIHKLTRPETPSFKHKAKEFCESKCVCSTQLAWEILQKRIPIVDWLPKYNIKNNLMSDILGGITIGIMQIPQGMAYALLANLPPVVGLYVSFFPVLAYFIFGTSRHVSVGTFAVVSLMTAKVINSYLSHHGLSAGNATSSLLNETMPILGTTNTVITENDLNTVKIQVAVAAAFFVGVIQLVMAVFQMGALSVYLSDTLISGFTTGAAVHVLNSQLTYLFGIPLVENPGLFGVIYTYIDIISTLHETNLVTLALSIAVTVFMVVGNDCINARFRHKMIMPVPTELILIVITTLSSYYLQMNHNYNVAIVKTIEKGLPPAVLPHFNIIPEIAQSCFSLAIISYCIPISLAKLSANKHKYNIDANQELVAYSAANILGSLFSCFPSCASLSRSTVQEMSGAKTQVASFVSCVLVLIVLLLMAPLFQPVPICVFAVIIIVSLRGMFRQVRDLPKAWKISKTEAAIWMVSCFATILLDVDIGLIVSIAFLLITVLYKLQKPNTVLLGRVPATDKYLDMTKYKVTEEVQGLKIVQFGGPLYFANRDYLRQQLYEQAFNPQQALEQRQKESRNYSKNPRLETAVSSQDLINDFKLDIDSIMYHHQRTGSISSETPTEIVNIDTASTSETANCCFEPVTAIIIDCSVINFIDSAAMNMLAQLHSEYEEVNVNLCFAGFNDNILIKLERCDHYVKLQEFLFPTIHDAVLQVNQRKCEANTQFYNPV